MGCAVHEQHIRTASSAQCDLPQGDQLLCCEWGTETYAAFRSVVSTAKANGTSVYDTIRFVLSAKRPVVVIAGVG